MFKAVASVARAGPRGLRTVRIRHEGANRSLGELFRALGQFSRRVFAMIAVEDDSTKVLCGLAAMENVSDSSDATRLCCDLRGNKQ